MRKRLLCVVLTLALLFSAQSAAAAAETGNQRSMIITAVTRLPVINVTVPSVGNVYLNPFRLPVDINGEYTDEQVISYPLYISSESDVSLQVDARVTGAVKAGSDMTLVSASTKGSASKAKSAFVYFEMQPSLSEDPYDVEWDAAYDASKHICVSTGGASKTDVVTLSPLGMYGEPVAGSYAAFRLTGDAIQSPTNAWTAQDGIDVTIAFTFTPIPYE